MPDSVSAIGLLYHYTCEAGLQGIIESGRIWATHVRFLNDYTEFRQAFTEVYVEALTEGFREGLPADIDSTARRVIEGELSNHRGILGIIEDSGRAMDAFVCSFTTLLKPSPEEQPGPDPGDRLSQWRGYSHSAQGFSLGFDKVFLEKQIGLDNAHAKAGVFECIYEDKDKRPFFQEMGRNACARFNERWLQGTEAVPPGFPTINPAPTEEYLKASFYFEKSLAEATAKFFTEAGRLKHSGFREECEWRIVLQARRDVLVRSGFVKFRKGQFGQTPFVEIPLCLAADTSPLRRIVVGPGSHKEEMKRWVELLLETRGIRVRPENRPDIKDGVEVAISVIPYRST
jgi:hypothetical protein